MASRGTFRLVVAAVVALAPSPGWAAWASGTVLDPQNLPVPGVRIQVMCGSEVRADVESDRQGQFSMALPPESNACRIWVKHPGFLPFDERIPTDAVIRVRLRLAPLEQLVNVTTKHGIFEDLFRTSLTSVSLGEADLMRFAGSTADLVRQATLVAGVTGANATVYVDGFPSALLPPREMVAGISVNADSFSPEYSDGDMASIAIVTKTSLDRRVRFQLSGEVLGVGGQDILGPGLNSDSSATGFGVSGPVPHLPLTFSVRGNGSHTSDDVSIGAVLPVRLSSDEVMSPTAATTEVRTRSGVLDVFYSVSANLNAHVTYRQSTSRSSNVAVGGLILPEAGWASFFDTSEIRGTLSGTAGRFFYRGGVVATQVDSRLRANSEGVGISVPGHFVAGGAPIGESVQRRTSWISKHMFTTRSSRPWTAGFTLGGSGMSIADTPNPAGMVQFEDLQAYASALEGNETGTWIVSRGAGTARYAGVTVSPFVQKQLVRSDHLGISGGLRADYQSGLGLLVSPRASAAGEWRSLRWEAGSGLFVRNLSDHLFIRVIENDGVRFRQFIAAPVALDGRTDAVPLDGHLVRAQLGPDLTRPRQLLARLSIERSLGRLVPGIEYTWTADQHVLGSERLSDERGWVDLLESNRSAARHRLHARLRYSTNGQMFVAHYEWSRSRDNSDGAYSFPEKPGWPDREWARSAGVSPHTVTGVANLFLPGAVSINITEFWHNSSPYNITTGVDVFANGLTNDRGGRDRNSANGPAYNALSVSALRRVPLPNVFKQPKGARMHASVGVQADNVFGHRNYISVGSVAGSATFGRPLAAMPGRSIRLWLSFD